MTTIYYDPQGNPEDNNHYPADKYAVSTNPDSWLLEDIAGEQQFFFSPNSYCAIIGWGIFTGLLSELPMELSGEEPFETGEETSLEPKALKQASAALRSYVAALPTLERDNDLEWEVTAEATYRIKIDRDELGTTLLALAAFVDAAAAKKGMMVEFWM